MAENTIPMVVSIPDDDSADRSLEKGWFSRDEESGLVNVPVDKLSTSVQQLGEQLNGIFASLRTVGDMPLKTVQVQVEVGVEGGVSIIGTAKVAGRGAITLTFGS